MLKKYLVLFLQLIPSFLLWIPSLIFLLLFIISNFTTLINASFHLNNEWQFWTTFSLSLLSTGFWVVYQQLIKRHEDVDRIIKYEKIRKITHLVQIGITGGFYFLIIIIMGAFIKQQSFNSQTCVPIFALACLNLVLTTLSYILWYKTSYPLSLID